MIWLLWWTWCLPQTLIGALVWIFVIMTRRCRGSRYQGAVVLSSQYLTWGVCLGPFIIVYDERWIDHEWGHTRQSLILGPLYLLVVGLPSMIHAAWWAAQKGRLDYFAFWTEAWANRLGGA